MRTLPLLSIFAIISVPIGAWAQNTSITQPSPLFTNLPLSFEQNIGQTSGEAQFIGRASGYTLFLSSNQAVFEFQTVSAPPEDRAARKRLGKQYIVQRARKSARKIELVRMRLIGANPGVHLVGVSPLSGTVNYLIGSDPSKWRTGVPLFEKVQSSEIFPGVDVVYYGKEKQLEYDFVVKPGADPNAISLGFEGVQSSSIDNAGNLAMSTAASLITLHQPLIYQVVSGQRKLVRGQYAQRGANAIGINVEAYDRSLPLVIDPVLSYSTYLGGSGVDGIGGVAVDSSGNAYVTGWTTSSNFPIVGTSLTPPPNGNQVAFVSKFNSTGTALVYSTYLGGSGGDSGNGIALDSNGSAYVVGDTGSTNFPTTSNAYQAQFHTGAIENAFVSKLSANGQSLLYSTYLGGGTDDLGFDIAVDANQNAYITGVTTSGSPAPFPTTAGALGTSLRSTAGDGFVSRIDTTQSGASSLVYSTFLGGSGTGGDNTSGIAVDANHNVYVGGQTCSTDFPLTSTAYQTVINTNGTGFLTQIDTTKAGSAGLIYSTVIEGVWQGHGVALDSVGKVYVTGGEYGFPAYVAKFDTTKSGSASFIYLTAVGGSNGDAFSYSVAVDGNGDAYFGGWTAATNLPTTSDAIQTSLGSGGQDSYVSVLSPNGSTVLFGTYIGGTGGSNDFALQVALDRSDSVYVAGSTGSSNFKTTSGAFQTSLKGTSDGFLSKFAPLNQPIINSANSAVFLTGTANSFTVTATGTPTPTLAESGSTPPLPTGVTFNPTTGVLSGTPGAGTAGIYSITFTATNGVSPSAAQTFTLTIVTPPSISSVISPAPNSAGWDNLNTTVAFTCTAGTYPIASCPSPVVVSAEGLGQIVTGTAADTAGFTATARVTINLDKTIPTLTVNSPADGTTESSSPVTVSGTLTDSLSGVSGVTCDGVAASLSGGGFSCNINLNVGNNLVVVRGTDVAGNVAADNFHLTLSGSLSTPSSLQVTPTGVNLVVGGTQQFTAVDNLGRPRPDATWTVSNTNLATIDTNGSPTLTAVAVGQVTLTATVGSLTAQTQVNILSGSSLAPGTTSWSVPALSSFFVRQVLHGVLWQDSPPDLYSVQATSNNAQKVISALTSDGRLLWNSATFSDVVLANSIFGVPDGTGGVLANTYQGLVNGSHGNRQLFDLDGQTGSTVWQYNSTKAVSRGVAIGGTANIYLADSDLTDTPQSSAFIELDGSTGAVVASFTPPPSTQTVISAPCNGKPSVTTTGYPGMIGPIVGPDGTAFVATAPPDQTTTYNSQCGFQITTVQTLSLIGMAPDGTTTATPFRTINADGNSKNWAFLSTGPGLIPDGQGGVLVAWYIPGGTSSNPNPSYHITDVTSSGAKDFTFPAFTSPVAQMALGDGGLIYATDFNTIAAFTISSGTQWTSSGGGNALTLIDTDSGGGLVAKSTTTSGVDTVLRFGSTGSLTSDSWTGSNLDYYIGNAWTGFSSAGGPLVAYSAAAVEFSSSAWFAPSMEQTNTATQDVTVSAFSQTGQNQTTIVGLLHEIFTALPLASFPGSLCNAWLGPNGASNLNAQLSANPPGWGHATVKVAGSTNYTIGAFTATKNADGTPTGVPAGVVTTVNDNGAFFNTNFPIFKPYNGQPHEVGIPKYPGKDIRGQATILFHEFGHALSLLNFQHDAWNPLAEKWNDSLVNANCGQFIQALPSATALSPSSGRVGTQVTISGTNFGSSQGSNTVTINGLSMPIVSWNANGKSIVVSVPSNAATGNVIVTISGAPATAPLFTVTP